MKRSRTWPWVIGAASIVVGTPLAFAADHIDSPAAVADPAADITDTYSWMDGNNLVMVMDVVPFADTASKFSDQVQYVFHTQSGASMSALTGAEMNVICTFDTAQKISCWAGDKDYVTGDASQTAGLTSMNGKFKVFAGLRDDPFFFNLDGFTDTVTTVEGAASSLTFNAAGCPALDSATSTTLVTKLKQDGNGGAGKDKFAGANVLSIVLSIDKTLVTPAGPVVAMWASTNKP